MKYEIVDVLTDVQIEELYSMIVKEWWGSNRNLADFKRAVRNSNIVIALCDQKSKKVVAFARAISDGIYKAILLDVIVDPFLRKTGLGKALMNEVINHPILKSVYVFDLFCTPEMVDFYKMWGFSDNLGTICCMRRICK